MAESRSQLRVTVLLPNTKHTAAHSPAPPCQVGSPRCSLASAPPSCRTWREGSPLPSACYVVAWKGEGQGMGKISRSPTARVQIPSCACELRGPGGVLPTNLWPPTNHKSTHSPPHRPSKLSSWEQPCGSSALNGPGPAPDSPHRIQGGSFHTSSGVGTITTPTRQRKGLEQSRL